MSTRFPQFGKVAQWGRASQWTSGDILRVSCGEDEWAGAGPDWESMVRELSHKLTGKAHENAELQERVDALEERVSRNEQLLKEMFDPTNLPIYGTFEQWRTSGEPVNSYRGKHVAFVAGKGVIASSDSLDELMEGVEKEGKPEGLIIGFVPVASALVSKC